MFFLIKKKEVKKETKLHEATEIFFLILLFVTTESNHFSSGGTVKIMG